MWSSVSACLGVNGFASGMISSPRGAEMSTAAEDTVDACRLEAVVFLPAGANAGRNCGLVVEAGAELNWQVRYGDALDSALEDKRNCREAIRGSGGGIGVDG